MRVDWSIFWPRILDATGDTLLMVIVTLIFATILGIPLGLLLYVTRKGNFLENKWVFFILNIIINTIRPIPFIIFLVALSPLTRSVIGTTIGTAAAIFPMTLVASIGIARMVEIALLVFVPKGVIEASQAMGASPIRIVFEVFVPESLAALILGVTFMTVGLIDFSAVAGVVGGGGLGDLAMTYGYQRFDTSVMFVTVVLLIILVQLAQNLGNYFAKVFLRRS
ncbi:ABC transporter permease [Bacillus anthracis]|nr:ABC transporter permease [Bacillus anthracis]KOS30812.1 ABC transporter permease [Bacillus anthracis]